MTTLKFKCNDTPNNRVVEYKTTLAGENIQHYVDAFRAFLLALEFHKDAIDRHLGEQE